MSEYNRVNALNRRLLMKPSDFYVGQHVAYVKDGVVREGVIFSIESNDSYVGKARVKIEDEESLYAIGYLAPWDLWNSERPYSLTYRIVFTGEINTDLVHDPGKLLVDVTADNEKDLKRWSPDVTSTIEWTE